MKKFNKNNFIKQKLRYISLRYPPRSEALKLSRKERGRYECSMCHGNFRSCEVQVDHINPVVPIDNDWEYQEIKWEIYIPRLFCNVEDFQVLCTACHSAKTLCEDQMRTFFHEQKRKAKKEQKKLDKKKS